MNYMNYMNNMNYMNYMIRENTLKYINSGISYIKNFYFKYLSRTYNFYTLYIYLDNLDDKTKQLYIDMVNTNNKNKYFKHVSNTFDCGIDLFTPENIIAISGEKCEINYNIKCAMKFNDRYVGYYLYPRSSTGSKTPLRMCNSVGIIDSGYRGCIKVYFDNINTKNFNIEKGNRYCQICPPSLDYPIKVVIVDKLEITERCDKGFGSSGQ